MFPSYVHHIPYTFNNKNEESFILQGPHEMLHFVLLENVSISWSKYICRRRNVISHSYSGRCGKAKKGTHVQLERKHGETHEM